MAVTAHSGSRLTTPTHLASYLIVVMCFSDWVLASINLRKFSASILNYYNPIDPSLVVCGVLSMFFYLGVITMGRSNAFKASTVLAVSALFAAWYFAMAVAYTVKRYSSDKFCSTNVLVRLATGCHGLYQALMAVTWVTFGLILIYMLHVFLLAKKHSKLPWTERANGMSTPVGRLCPGDFRTKEQLEAQETGRH